MTLFQQLLIAVVQGITEFLPISSSGHLILIPYLTDLPDQGPLIDVAVHVGSLLAIIIYFWRDVGGLARGGFATVGLGKDPLQRRLFLWVVAGTVPAVAFGLFLKLGGYMESFRITDLVAVNLIVYGLLLGAADRWGRQEKDFEDASLRDAIIIGLAQALALIPGHQPFWRNHDGGQGAGLQAGGGGAILVPAGDPGSHGRWPAGGARSGRSFGPDAVGRAAHRGVHLCCCLRNDGVPDELPQARIDAGLRVYRVALGIALLVWF
jgi:hypothetical protein